MTIKEFAKNHHVSPQAVYGKLSSEGVKVAQIVDQKTKQITDAGMEVLKQYYSSDDSLTVKIRAL